MNNNIDLTKPIKFGETFTYSFQFLKKNYLSMLPYLALFFIPTIIIFIIASYPCYIRLTPILNDYISLTVNIENFSELQRANIQSQFQSFSFFILPLELISVFSIFLSLSAVMEFIKKKIENREESFKETVQRIFSGYTPFLFTVFGGTLLLSFISMIGSPVFSIPFLIYFISLLTFIPQLSYFGNRGVSQSFKDSFILSRKKVLFFFGLFTFLYILFNIIAFFISLLGNIIINFRDIRDIFSFIFNIREPGAIEIPPAFNGKFLAKTLLIFFGGTGISAQFFLIPFFSVATSFHYFSLRNINPLEKKETEQDKAESEDFLTDKLPL